MKQFFLLGISIVTSLVACSTIPTGCETDDIAKWSAVPAIFEQDRVFLKFQANHRTLFFFSDSGGGTVPFTFRDVLKRVNLPFKEVGTAEDRKEGFLGIVEVPDLGFTRVFDEKLSEDSELSLIRKFVKDGFWSRYLGMGLP